MVLSRYVAGELITEMRGLVNHLSKMDLYGDPVRGYWNVIPGLSELEKIGKRLIVRTLLRSFHGVKHPPDDQA